MKSKVLKTSAALGLLSASTLVFAAHDCCGDLAACCAALLSCCF